MRLAGDPLLLRAFLSRPEHPADGHWRSPGPGVPFAGLAQKAPTEAPSPSACRYGQREALLAPSLFPERFDASGEDWSAPEDTGGVAGHDGAARWLPAVAGLALVLGLLCLLLALSV